MSAAYPADAFGGGAVASVGPPRWLAAVAGTLTVLVGIAALVWPGPTLLVVGLLFGAYFAVWGVAFLIRGVAEPGLSGGLRVLDIVVGVLAILGGVLLMVRPGASVLTVAWILGFWWVMSGALQIVRGVVEPVGRVWNLLWGVVAVAAGAIILASPEIALGTLVLIVGIGLILQGLFELLIAFTLLPGREHA